MSSNTDKFSGKAKQVAGKATDNTQLQAKGKAQESKGNFKAAGEKLVDEADDAINGSGNRP